MFFIETFCDFDFGFEENGFLDGKVHQRKKDFKIVKMFLAINDFRIKLSLDLTEL